MGWAKRVRRAVKRAGRKVKATTKRSGKKAKSAFGFGGADFDFPEAKVQAFKDVVEPETKHIGSGTLSYRTKKRVEV